MNPVEQLNTALTGRYEVEREIGAGGMATVYLARDVRHERRVALKLLRPELGAVLGVERFLSEIRVTANLQHPNLLPLFDSGEADGLLFYVMPYVEGESLRHRIDREKQLPIDEALHIAAAVASALDYAHRHGVIHRDLKPENILLHEGQPLVADFGIALAVSNAGGARITQTGLSLGTPQYMSPEQATGDRTIDGRTDIYSLAAVLYEMLAGEPPHTGSTVQAVIARVLTDRPRSVRASRETVPEHVDAALQKALAKLPADRFATAHEFAEALAGRGATVPAGLPTPGTFTTFAPSAASRRARVSTVAVGLIAVAAVAAAAWGWLRPTGRAEEYAVRFEVRLDSAAAPQIGAPPGIAVSRDGRTIVYRGRDQLWVRTLDEPTLRPIPGTDGALEPAISPDGRTLAFARLGRIKRVPFDGGPPTDVAESPSNAGLTWVSDHEIVVGMAPRGPATLWLVSADGGQPTEIAPLDSASGERFKQDPVAVPGTRLVVYTSLGPGGLTDERLAVLSLDDGKATMLGLRGARPLGVADGQLVYVREDGAVLATPFDARARRVDGPGTVVAENVLVSPSGTSASLGASGTLAYIRGTTTSTLVVARPGGGETPLATEPRTYSHPRLSPDGTRLAVDIGGNNHLDIWVQDVGSGALSRLTSEGENDRPEWSPDGRTLIYTSSRAGGEITTRTAGGRFAIWQQPADGSASATLLYSGPNSIREAVFTPDGKGIVFREDNPTRRRDIHFLPLDDARKPIPLLTSEFDELMPRVSPDGKWLAYQSDESGEYEVYVRPFPNAGGRFRVSLGGGREPLWSRDGKQLFYRAGSQFIAASIATSAAGTVTVTSRAPVLDGRYLTHPYHANYDISADGRGFVVVRPTSAEMQLVVIHNWGARLRAGAK